MIFSPPFLRCLTLVLWPFHKGFGFLLHKFHFLGFLLQSFLRTLFGLSSCGCPSMACPHGVPVWRVPLVSLYGVSPRCPSMACPLGVPVRRVPLVFQYGVSPWCPRRAWLLVFVLTGFQCVRNATESNNR